MVNHKPGNIYPFSMNNIWVQLEINRYLVAPNTVISNSGLYKYLYNPNYVIIIPLDVIDITLY